MDRFKITFSTSSFTEDFEVYAFHFGDALEKAINMFRKKYTRFHSVYRVVIRRYEDDYVTY